MSSDLFASNTCPKCNGSKIVNVQSEDLATGRKFMVNQTCPACCPHTEIFKGLCFSCYERVDMTPTPEEMARYRVGKAEYVKIPGISRQKQLESRICMTCGEEFQGSNLTYYCSIRCKDRASYTRRRDRDRERGR